MPIIYTYPTKSPALDDWIIISDVSETNPKNATRKCTISDILAMGTGEDYDLNAGAKVGTYVPLNLTSTSGTDDSLVKLTEGTNITLTRNSATEITIDAAGGGGTMSQWSVRDDDNDDGVVTGSNNFVKFVAATGALSTNLTGTGTTVDPFVMTITSPDTDTTYSAMDTTTLGLGKLSYTRGATPAAEAQSTTASRTYGVTDNASNQLVVNVPWTDTNTTYSKATDAVLGLVKLEDVAVQTTAANAITTTASRTYGVQFNASDQLVVNVPWTGGGATGTLTALGANTYPILVHRGADGSGALTVVDGIEYLDRAGQFYILDKQVYFDFYIKFKLAEGFPGHQETVGLAIDTASTTAAIADSTGVAIAGLQTLAGLANLNPNNKINASVSIGQYLAYDTVTSAPSTANFIGDGIMRMCIMGGKLNHFNPGGSAASALWFWTTVASNGAAGGGAEWGNAAPTQIIYSPQEIAHPMEWWQLDGETSPEFELSGSVHPILTA